MKKLRLADMLDLGPPQSSPSTLDAQPPSRPEAQDSGDPVIQPSSSPVAQVSRFPLSQTAILPDNLLPKIPETQTTTFPVAQDSGHPDSQASLLPGGQPPKPPGVRKSKSPKAQVPSSPIAQQSSRPAVQPPTFPHSHTPRFPVGQESSDDDDDILGLNLEQLSPEAWTSNVEAQAPSQDFRTAGLLEAQIKAYRTQVEMTYKSRTERIKKNVRLPNEKVAKYEAWCFAYKISFQDAVEMALDYLTGLPDPHVLINKKLDNLDDKSSSILQFYAKWTRNRPTAKDREALLQIYHLPIGIIHCGIMLSVIRKAMANDGQRISTLKYCIGAILETEKNNIADPAEYMRYLTTTASKLGIQGKPETEN
jgi:hypothetical protein